MQSDPLGDPLSILQTGIGHHHHELLPAIATGQIDGPHVGGQAHRELQQNLVADIVAVAVIDLFEVIDVDQQA